jgi:hypothetical protein
VLSSSFVDIEVGLAFRLPARSNAERCTADQTLGFEMLSAELVDLEVGVASGFDGRARWGVHRGTLDSDGAARLQGR